MQNMKGCMKVILLFFSKELPNPLHLFYSELSLTFTTITIKIKFTYIMGTSFTKLLLFFHKVSFIIHILSTFVRDAVYWLHNTLCLSVGDLHACCFSSVSSTEQRPRTAAFRGPKIWKLEGAKSGQQGDSGRTVHSIVGTASEVYRLVCGLALSCRRSWFIFLFVVNPLNLLF